MENLVKLIHKIKLDDNLISFCKVQLLTSEDIVSLRTRNDWRVELKINIEYDLSYDKLYNGVWNEVPEEHRRVFQLFSFLKAHCIVKDPKNQSLDRLLQALHILDTGIIVVSESEESALLIEFAQLLHEIIGKDKKSSA